MKRKHFISVDVIVAHVEKFKMFILAQKKRGNIYHTGLLGPETVKWLTTAAENFK